MILRAENIVKVYGKRTVVQGVSFDVNQGEIVGLLGPNGAGKTTSFYMTVGFIQPTSGNVYLDNEEIKEISVMGNAKTDFLFHLILSIYI